MDGGGGDDDSRGDETTNYTLILFFFFLHRVSGIDPVTALTFSDLWTVGLNFNLFRRERYSSPGIVFVGIPLLLLPDHHHSSDGRKPVFFFLTKPCTVNNTPGTHTRPWNEIRKIPGQRGWKSGALVENRAGCRENLSGLCSRTRKISVDRKTFIFLLLFFFISKKTKKIRNKCTRRR